MAYSDLYRKQVALLVKTLPYVATSLPLEICRVRYVIRPYLEAIQA